MPLSMEVGLGLGHIVLDGSPEVLRDVAMATNLGTLFDTRGWFSGSSYPKKMWSRSNV